MHRATLISRRLSPRSLLCIARIRYGRKYYNRAFEAVYKQAPEQFLKVANKAVVQAEQSDGPVVDEYVRNGHVLSSGGKGLVCQRCLHSSDGLGDIRHPREGWPATIKKLADSIAVKGGEDVHGHKLWAVRVIEGPDEGKIMAFSSSLPLSLSLHPSLSPLSSFSSVCLSSRFAFRSSPFSCLFSFSPSLFILSLSLNLCLSQCLSRFIVFLVCNLCICVYIYIYE